MYTMWSHGNVRVGAIVVDQKDVLDVVEENAHEGSVFQVKCVGRSNNASCDVVTVDILGDGRRGDVRSDAFQVAYGNQRQQRKRHDCGGTHQLKVFVDEGGNGMENAVERCADGGRAAVVHFFSDPFSSLWRMVRQS